MSAPGVVGMVLGGDPRWIALAILLAARATAAPPARWAAVVAVPAGVGRLHGGRTTWMREVIGRAMRRLIGRSVSKRHLDNPNASSRLAWRMASRVVDAPPRLLGSWALLGGVGAVMAARSGPFPVASLVVFGSVLAAVRRRSTARREQAAIAASIPDLVDLVRLTLEGGATVVTGLCAVATTHRGPLAGHLRLLERDLVDGVGVTVALEHFLERSGDAVRPMCSALLASERYGLPVGGVLDTLAREARAARQRAAEVRARRLTVTMLFPLITCILPAFAVLTVVPLLASGLRSVHW